MRRTPSTAARSQSRPATTTRRRCARPAPTTWSRRSRRSCRWVEGAPQGALGDRLRLSATLLFGLGNGGLVQRPAVVDALLRLVRLALALAGADGRGDRLLGLDDGQQHLAVVAVGRRLDHHGPAR